MIPVRRHAAKAIIRCTVAVTGKFPLSYKSKPDRAVHKQGARTFHPTGRGYHEHRLSSRGDMSGNATYRPLRLELRNRQSLLLFLNIRRDSSCWLVVIDGGHFLSIGLYRDLLYSLDFAVALVSHLNGVVP